MPANVVKTEHDEELWERAKEIVQKQYKGVNEGSKRFYRLVMGIYQRMKGDKSMARSLAKGRNGQLYMIRSFKKSELLVGGHNWPPKTAGPDMGMEELRGALDLAIKEYMGPAKGAATEPAMDPYPWIEDIYPNYVIVRKGAERYRVFYKMANGKIEIGPKEKVRAVYVPVEKSRAKSIRQAPPKECPEEAEEHSEINKSLGIRDYLHKTRNV